MPDFSKRSYDEELMDDLESGGYDLEQSLRELAFINKWLGGEKVLLDGLNQQKTELQQQNTPVKIGDIGCGGGDLLQTTREWGLKNNLELSLKGIDANPHVINFARNFTTSPEIEFSQSDIFQREFQQETFDITLLTLFFHHFRDSTLIALLKQLRGQTKTAIIINDLHRHPVAYYFISLFTRLFSRTTMVKNDGPLSVLRAFKKAELENILQNAGIFNYQIRWFWPFRYQVLIK